MRSLAKIAFRILLIYLFINSLSVAVSTINTNFNIYFRTQNGDFSYVIWAIIASIIILGFIIFLFIKAGSVIRLLAGNDVDDTQLVISTTRSELFEVLLKFLGIYLLIHSLSALLGLWGYYLNYSHAQGDPSITASEIQSLINNGFTLIVSIILIAGGNGIVKGLRNFWNHAGVNEKQD